MKLVRINKKCICGGMWKGDVAPKAAKAILLEWDKSHSGNGHGPCDAKTAAKSRAKEEMKIINKVRYE